MLQRAQFFGILMLETAEIFERIRDGVAAVS